MIAETPKIVRIQDHPDYERYLNAVRANQEKKAQEMVLSYEEYAEKLNLGFEYL